ncbi:MAG: peptidoglycan editing factor PgeF [Gammaproteobacteria bacterium]|nr:peptidoglycan editing factor PgeF [Gammaproteobacteria bacterium]
MPNTSASWIVADWPAPAVVQAGCSTRLGGVSIGPYGSFNLAQHVNDDPLAVSRNRERLIKQQSLPSEPLWLNQVHGCEVFNATQQRQPPPRADASISIQVGVVCAVLSADCLPVLITDRRGSCVAAVHAGWRGLLAGVISATVKQLPASPADLLVWLGPAIGPTAFEVGVEVQRGFIQRHPAYAKVFVAQAPQHWWMDLYAAARLELQQLGVNSVYGGKYCTYRDSHYFYSYRREAITGRMASLIWLAA